MLKAVGILVLVIVAIWAIRTAAKDHEGSYFRWTFPVKCILFFYIGILVISIIASIPVFIYRFFTDTVFWINLPKILATGLVIFGAPYAAYWLWQRFKYRT